MSWRQHDLYGLWFKWDDFAVAKKETFEGDIISFMLHVMDIFKPSYSETVYIVTAICCK